MQNVVNNVEMDVDDHVLLLQKLRYYYEVKIDTLWGSTEIAFGGLWEE